MKNVYFNIVIILITLDGNLYAQEAKLHLREFTPQFTISTLTVYGKCGTCTRRILKAVNEKGVKSAYWDMDDQMLTVQYDSKKITMNRIHTFLALAGHDTEKIKASPETYSALPACCRYRKLESSINQIKKQ